MKKTFGELVEKKQKYRTPGTPGQGVLRPESEEMKIPSEKQKHFRSGVGIPVINIDGKSELVIGAIHRYALRDLDYHQCIKSICEK